MPLIKQRNKKTLRPEVDVGDFSKLFGYKMLIRKLLKLKWPHESPPTV